ncbi:piggyBac transposable element-derived protein 4-like [Photinus pyralis]|uniref:piggyBac transposable element-derived protein 4-like n=1 Tax=Photinus pyralis TaxID=7054 RepID=UPI00126767D0|nr:piggyBac transposable element-derived protein 4-like [Photinus pyralis]XP_031350534.1 piggyBac transposable element-derived protein 4-like [Photinus pyralis]
MSYYEKEQRHLLELWNELEEEVVGGSDDEEDVQEDFGETSNHESEFELSEDEELSEQNIKSGLCFIGKDKNTLWSKFILRALRFDNVNDREFRKQFDKLAPIREIFDDFVYRCKTNYNVSELVTIDEMLESFRGRCAFRQYIPNKPAKYGLKILAMVDARSFYTHNLEVYVGNRPDGPFKVDNSAAVVVKRLIQPISGTGRNVTCDNWFTSIPLALELLQKHNLTLVGTLRKNKREIPEFFSAKIKERRINTSMFGFTKDMTLVSYKPKQNKIVLLLSTMHYADEIDQETGDACKPAMITFYNSTKGGVDELKGNYSVSRKSSRWPLTIFFSMLNIAGINSQII